MLPLALLGFVTQLQILQNGYDSSGMLGIFSAAVSVWSIFMLEGWKRKEWHHTVTWGMSHFSVAETEVFILFFMVVQVQRNMTIFIRYLPIKTQRPEFVGEVRPSLRDGTPETYYPEWSRRVNLARSSAASITFIVVNLVLQVTRQRGLRRSSQQWTMGGLPRAPPPNARSGSLASGRW